MRLRMFPRRPKLPQINISTPRIQNLREDVRYSIWRIFLPIFLPKTRRNPHIFLLFSPNTIWTGDLVHFPDYVETLPVFYIILWLLGLSGSFLDYSNIFQIFRTPSGQARKNFRFCKNIANTLVFLTHQIKNIKNMKVPPSVQEVMVCWGLTQRESDKIKMSLDQLKWTIFLTNHTDLKKLNLNLNLISILS